MRTKVAQKKAVSAPYQDMVSSPPSSGGPSTDPSASAGKSRSTRNGVAVGDQVGGEALAVGGLSLEQPAAVCEEQPFGEAGRGGAVTPWGMRVTLAVGECVVAPVVGDPLDQGTLQGQRSGHRQADPERAFGFERAMGEVPVKARRHAESADEIEGEADRDVQPGQTPAPGDRNRGQQRHERYDDADHEDDHRIAGNRFVQERSARIGPWPAGKVDGVHLEGAFALHCCGSPAA